ncbi:S1C family serine protease [Aliikangiella marina]|nr:trypsin-like peptidase domain-containing protein [Aliikangiella marina]
MPNSKLSFNWQSAQSAWQFYLQQTQEKTPHEEVPHLNITDISFSEAVQKVSSSVVSINVFRPKGFRDSAQLSSDQRIFDYGVGFGSGVVISKEGYIVTNYHVVANAEQISVNLPDGRKRFTEIIGFDKETDIAVLKTDLSDLTPAVFADSETVDTGDLVMAIGSPFGQNQSVSLGIVSAITYSGFDPRIQTDAAINSGNSGGALINTRGEVIGINHSKVNLGSSLAQTGVNFAIPIDTVQEIVASIIKIGRFQRNWSGIEATELIQSDHERLFPNIPYKTGFFVRSIVPGSPAAEADLIIGDYVTHLDGIKISGVEAFYRLYTKLPIGKKITLDIIRKNNRMKINVQLRERPDNTQP